MLYAKRGGEESVVANDNLGGETIGLETACVSLSPLPSSLASMFSLDTQVSLLGRPPDHPRPGLGQDWAGLPRAGGCARLRSEGGEGRY